MTNITIEKIGDYAFCNCYTLAEIIIPEGVISIGDYAFNDCCNLTEITIPESVIYIEKNPFSCCDSLKQINVPLEHPYYSVSENVLFDKEEKSLVCYPSGLTDKSYTVPEGIEKIEDAAFAGCSNLTEITIPESILSIGYDSFDECDNLKKVIVEPGSYAEWYAIENQMPLSYK